MSEGVEFAALTVTWALMVAGVVKGFSGWSVAAALSLTVTFLACAPPLVTVFVTVVVAVVAGLLIRRVTAPGEVPA